jgi:hypothetical protein
MVFQDLDHVPGFCLAWSTTRNRVDPKFHVPAGQPEYDDIVNLKVPAGASYLVIYRDAPSITRGLCHCSPWNYATPFKEEI